MYIDETVIAGLLVLAGTIAVGGYVIYYALHDIKVKEREKRKAH
ncbi:MAG: hypothetical protein ACPGZU_18125 [Ketobacter sp.]